jgi:hypothetical protein
MRHGLSPDDLCFRKRFVANQIAPAEFHHREHLRLAYIYLVEHRLRAMEEFRSSLLAFLAHNNVDAAKYHATLTQAWLQAVSYFMTRSGSSSSDSESFLRDNEVLLDPQIMLTHYSENVITSAAARQHFVQPDRQPIPHYSG